MDNLVLIERVLRIAVCIAVLISLFILISQSITVDRWQERAINNYNTAILNNQKPEHQPESWWCQNPVIVGLKVWIFDVNNLISIFFGFLFSGIKLLIAKYHLSKFLHFSGD